MIGYTTVGTNDFERALTFYDSLLSQLEAKRLYSNEREAYWGHTPDGVKFAVVRPFDGEPASAGNGSMVALRAENRQQVERVHRSALELGGTDEGAPGPRGTGSFFGAYFRDPDGHKVCVFVT